MANIVSHVVTVTGPPEAVRSFKAQMIGRGPTLDFGALVPMPRILEGAESSSAASDGLILLGEDDLPDPLISLSTVGEQARRMLDYRWVREAGVTDRAGLDALLRKRATADGGVERRLLLGRAANAAFKETGHVSFSSWANEHWGCTGARDLEILEDEPGRLALSFGTAWSSPEPIWEKIAATFLDVTVAVEGFEEAWQFAVAGTIGGGRNGVVDVDPTPEIYERVYGEPYEEDAEGDEDAPAAGVSTNSADRRPPVAKPPGRWAWAERLNWDLVGWVIAGVGLAVYLLWW